MADDTDFASLYRELGIRDACTPDAFRRAYRRRVSQLHPDQRGSQADVARLQELNRLYDAANEFLLANGRLPGAATAAQDPHVIEGPAKETVPDAYPWAAPAMQAAGAAPPPEEGPPAGTHQLSRYFILLAVLAIAALAISALKGMMPLKHETQDATAVHVPVLAQDGIGDSVRLGMGKQEVKAIQGAPVGSHDIRWDYGPSWIDFRCGDVVTDWYSSPLRPLRTATPHPTPRDWDKFDAARPPGC